MFSKMLRMQFLGPMQLSRLVMYLPQFVRLFYRLINDGRVPMLAKMVPAIGLLLMLTPPALELDMFPRVANLDGFLSPTSRSKFSSGSARPTSCGNTSAKSAVANSAA